MANSNECEEYHVFPAWYYKKQPGFLKVENYKILAAWDRGVKTEEQWLREEGVEEEKGGEQEMQCILEADDAIEMQNNKRIQCDVYLEEGIEQTPP